MQSPPQHIIRHTGNHLRDSVVAYSVTLKQRSFESWYVFKYEMDVPCTGNNWMNGREMFRQKINATTEQIDGWKCRQTLTAQVVKSSLSRDSNNFQPINHCEKLDSYSLSIQSEISQTEFVRHCKSVEKEILKIIPV